MACGPHPVLGRLSLPFPGWQRVYHGEHIAAGLAPGGRHPGYNPAALGMLWTFAGGGKLFLYQNTALILGYSYGFFTVKDLFKVGAVLTVVEGLLDPGTGPSLLAADRVVLANNSTSTGKVISYVSDIPEI